MTDLISIEQRDHVLLIGLNRPDKKNAINTEMFRGLSTAYTQLCDDPALRCGILHSNADLFSAGLDLMDMAPALTGQEGNNLRTLTEDDQVDPFKWSSVGAKVGRLRDKPLIAAINGRCYAAGIELSLGADILLAEESSTFAQAEIRRGLMPLGGGIDRLVARAGWGNAMRWLLTGDEFDAKEAYRIGLIQEITPDGRVLDRALEIAARITSAAPLGVKGTLLNATEGAMNGPLAAAEQMRPYAFETIAQSKDIQEGIAALFQKREPNFIGE